ncbi:MAG: nuclease A inhibitor family protein [Niabella sp.]
MENTSIAALEQITEELMYYSESEYPVSIIQLSAANKNELVALLAKTQKVSIETVKNIPVKDFFGRFEDYLAFNGPDTVMNNNAARFLELYLFLKSRYNPILVYRIEQPGKALIPIYILGQSKQGDFTGVATMAVET